MSGENINHDTNEPGSEWRGPTILAIARHARVGTATVDRISNGRGNVGQATRLKVLGALGTAEASVGRRRGSVRNAHRLFV